MNATAVGHAICFHDLHLTAATLLAQQGVHVTAVPRLVGHSSTSMTLDIYSHVYPDAERNATATLDRLLIERATDQEDVKSQAKLASNLHTETMPDS